MPIDKSIDYSAITPEIKALTKLCLADNVIEPEMYVKYAVNRGLRDLNGNGVLTGLTEISEIQSSKMVDGEKVPCEGKLFYRGINVEDLIHGFVSEKRFGFEETAFLLLMGRWREALKSEELHWYLALIAASVLAIALGIRDSSGGMLAALRHAFFNVSSITSTTGFCTVDYVQWPDYCQWILVILMFCGACAGSTGGGLKVTRVVTLVKAAFMDMRKMIHPNAVVNVRMEGRAMPEKQVRGVQAYFSVYMLLYAVSWLLLSLNGFDLLSTFTALSACINNIGPGLGMVGPTGNFSAFAPWAKLLLSFDMLAGRLEIFPMLLLFVPSTWRGNRLRRWERRN